MPALVSAKGNETLLRKAFIQELKSLGDAAVSQRTQFEEAMLTASVAEVIVNRGEAVLTSYYGARHTVEFLNLPETVPFTELLTKIEDRCKKILRDGMAAEVDEAAFAAADRACSMAAAAQIMGLVREYRKQL